MKTLNANSPLYELVKADPEITELMYDLGFHEIKIPGMIQTAGRKVTIAQGAKMKHIEWSDIVNKFKTAGFEFDGVPDDEEN